MSNTQSPVAKDHPLMLAWEAYKATDKYKNTLSWASKPEHVEGSLWATFMEGWLRAGGERTDGNCKIDHETIERLLEDLESRYDGFVGSKTRWMGTYIADLKRSLSENKEWLEKGGQQK